MGISSWSWFKQHIDQKSLNWWERSSEYVCFTYMWITASNLISDNDVNSLFHNPILFPYLRNILSLGSLFNCCCQYFWSYFETHPGCVTSWPLDSGSSVIPTKTTVNLLSLQGLLSLSLFFSSGGKLISFLPGVSVVDLIYPLMVQWLRIHLPMQGTQVWSLVGEWRSHKPHGTVIIII